MLQQTLVWLGSHGMYQREKGKSFSVVVSLLTANWLHTETCCSPRPPLRVITAATYNHHSDCSVTRENQASINVATFEEIKKTPATKIISVNLRQRVEEQSSVEVLCL